MTSIFIRLLHDPEKRNALNSVVESVRQGKASDRVFLVEKEEFSALPGSPLAYWCGESIRAIFGLFPPYENDVRTVKFGLSTTDDFRFVRTWWELESENYDGIKRWPPFVKGGRHSKFYSDIRVSVNWNHLGKELYANCGIPFGGSGAPMRNPQSYFVRGMTWPLRGVVFSSQAVPDGCIFSSGGKIAFADKNELSALLALFNSAPFNYFIGLFAGKVGGVQYEVGLIQKMPIPPISPGVRQQLSSLASRAWSLKRTLDTIEETSHAFALPSALRTRLCDYDPPAIEAELARIQTEIDAIAFDLYGFIDADRATVLTSQGASNDRDTEITIDDESNDEEDIAPIDQTIGILSWAVGVAFGRFDWRLATGERAVSLEPEPFDPLPAKSPGMLPDGAVPFHAHAGILVEDQGHPDDLARLIEEVLVRVEMPVPEDVRRWLQRDFFAFHLQRYSKSRRKAPIYWPLSTTSGGYTMWVYYPSLTSQTLYTAINDFVEPKLKQVDADVTALRNKGSARSREDEKQFEALQTFELELIELRDTLLKLAPTYKPDHDDGVQISAAPLWPLFRHKPWQKVLKDTWAKLEKGDYDWAHLAMHYWPDRVREKCKTDKSLAIAHGLEDLYITPEAKPKKSRGRGK